MNEDIVNINLLISDEPNDCLLRLSHPQYLAEVSDPLHRPWFFPQFPGLKKIFDFWFCGHTDTDLWTWMASKEATSSVKSLGLSEIPSIQYLGQEDLEKHKITIKDGILLDSNQKPLSTQGYCTDGKKGQALIIVNPNGDMYLGNHIRGKLQHTSLSHGNPVVFAGEISCENGLITRISNRSGHYLPSTYCMYKFLKHLSDVGLKTEHLLVHDEAKQQEYHIDNLDTHVCKFFMSNTSKELQSIPNDVEKPIIINKDISLEDLAKVISFTGHKVSEKELAIIKDQIFVGTKKRPTHSTSNKSAKKDTQESQEVTPKRANHV